MTTAVKLSELTRVPKVKKATIKLLEKQKRVGEFTLAVLRFTAAYRGKIVSTYLEALKAHMRNEVIDGHYMDPSGLGIHTHKGEPYNQSSLYSLIKKALVYAEL